MDNDGQQRRIDLRARVDSALERRVADDLLRQRRTVSHCRQAHVSCDGQRLLDFAGNDYLGLAHHPAMVSAMQVAAQNCGVGAGASHMVCGHHQEHEALERAIAQWLGYPRALLFGAGYLANLAVMQALLQAGDVCLQDKLDHASLIDGARLSQARLVRYPHADVVAARRQAQAHAEGALLLATDGVFSMDGDVAPLRDLALVARAQKALLYVDDAHGVGVSGPEGRGSVAAAGLGVDEVPLQLATLGKALGGYGAVVVGDEALVRHLAETARPYLYTTALPPALAAATRVAVRHARRDQWRRDRLGELVARFRRGAIRHGLSPMDSDSPIQPLLCGDDATALAMSAALERAGYLVTAIRPPTVPEGKARLRVTLSAAHDPAQVDALVDALAQARDALRNGAAA